MHSGSTNPMTPRILARNLLASASLVTCSVACSSGGSAVSAEARQEATTIFSQRCTPCHGTNGAGDGPASQGLTPPPRDFREPAWQDSVDDAHIANIIRGGGAAVGKSPAMPPNPDLADKTEVVNALVEHIRGLRH
jgi:mono/diheme cytochrome c family protein